MGSMPATKHSLPPSRYLCLTILGYRTPGMSEEAYREHMHRVSAPMTKDLMVKYGVKRWTMHTMPNNVRKADLETYQIHNPMQTRDLMTQLFDRQMANVADYDCFSQVVFESIEHYKMMKEDPYYKAHLFGDHENFADTKRSK
ncbi:hypothetical protein LTR22_021808 [Elasticomyces elasticus]|nr:hypothetical protein LTR22_021808 [Elasticomyces elasticus]